MLDPFPAGSGTVGSDALWMDRISLTLRSRPIMGRFMSAQLNAIGLDMYIAETVDEYILKSVDIAGSNEKRARLINDSSGLRERMRASDLCNYEKYGRELGRVLREAWIKYCSECLHG